MKIVLLALFFISALSFDNPFYTYEDGVVILNDKNFEQALHEFEYAFVEFYAPWCGHCQKLVPEFAKAAQMLAESRPEIKLCKIDATVETEAAKKYEVRGYPTILFFVKGRKNPIPFVYANSAVTIVSWILERAGPASKEINDIEAAEKLIADNEVVAFFFGSATSEAYSQFIDVANEMDKIAYANTNEQALKDKFDVKDDEAIILFKKFDEGRNTFTGPFDIKNILIFIEKNRFPVIIPFDYRFSSKIFGEYNEIVFLVTDVSEAGVRAKEVFTETAPEIKDKILICVATVGQPMVDMLMNTIGIAKDAVPAIRIYQPSQEPGATKKYAYEGEFTENNIKTFVEDFVSNRLRPFYKSEPIPETTHEDGVRVVVGKNFEDVVLGDDNDVLMVYYAPLCTPCKAMAPIYSSFANSLKDVEGLVIGKMDTTKNEAESLKTKGFPTIRFYPKGAKSNPFDFTGEHTEEEFLDFVKKYTTINHPKLSQKIYIDL